MYQNYRITDIERNLSRAGFHYLDVMLVGSTGSGKSTTLNAIVGQEVAKVGYGCDPETKKISPVFLNDKMRFWDTPGCGEYDDTDRFHKLARKLSEGYGNIGQYGTIDLVVLILDGLSSRDMGVANELLNKVIIPNIQANRILVAINQADLAMKDRHWDEIRNCPDSVLKSFLEEKAESVRKRLAANTSLRVAKPVYYSAERGYHVREFLDLIIDNMPREKRLLKEMNAPKSADPFTNKTYRFDDISRNLAQLGYRPLDVLVVGGTGAGKSSTLNALFGEEVATVGHSCDPETMKISAVSLNEKLRFWDTPGLGDNVELDKSHKRALKDKLSQTYSLDGGTYGFIDIVVVIIDGSSRDMETANNLLTEVIIPNIQANRILVAINQADMAKGGRHWDEIRNCPDSVLKSFLEEKAESVRKRLAANTSLRVAKPVYYSAEREYHVRELLDLIIDNMPRERRALMH